MTFLTGKTLNARVVIVAVQVLLIALGAASIPAHAETVIVSAGASIFGAGNAGNSSDSSGSAPPSINVLLYGPVLSFTSVTGFTAAGTSGPIDVGPDGAPNATVVNLNSWGGISGIIDNDGSPMALYGVFTSGPIPPGQLAPARLDVTGSFKSQPSFAPLLSQTFFIGDGLTGTGTGALQTFDVPFGATALFLGFGDGFAFNGDPSLYSDNRGSLTVEVASARATPEPSTLVSMVIGMLGLATIRRRARL